MKKKHNIKKIVIISLTAILLFFIIGYLLNNRKKNSGVKEILESMDCIFYEEYQSSENGVDTDILVEFRTMPIDRIHLNSNKYYYENLIKAVSTKLKEQTFRIIDEKNNIAIKAKEDNKKVSYTINGSSNYYETEIAKLSQKSKEKETELEILSNEMNTIVNNDWSRTQSRSVLGTADNHVDDYDCYIDEGYKIKTINIKIFNIVFTKNYTKEVFKGIKTGLTNREIKAILGTPTYENEDAEMLVGYKTEKYYVFFCQGEISIYRIEENKEEDNNKFSNLVTELNQNKNYDEFINKLTELYPDYVKYIDNGNNVELVYPQRGFKFEINNYKKGLTFYKNYEGKITNEISSENIQSINSLPPNIFYNKYNSVFDYELQRIQNNYKFGNNK